ncbi:hypothetical protein HDU76_007822, partial [Blyttiomyces sp. JEL0837]
PTEIILANRADLAKTLRINENEINRLVLTASSAIYSASTNSIQCIQKQEAKLTTGDSVLDGLFRGGLATGGITEIYGPSGSGKTQFSLTLCLTVQWPLELGGLNAGAIYIATEQLFPSHRFFELANLYERHGRSSQLPGGYGENVHIMHVRDLETQHHIVQYQVPALMEAHNIRLIVIDSMAANYRGTLEFGKMDWKGQAVSLFELGRSLKRTADRNGGAVVLCVNQVSGNMDDRSRVSMVAVANGNADNPLEKSLMIEDTAAAGLMGREDGYVPTLGISWSSTVNTRIALSRCYDASEPGESFDSGDGTGRKRLRRIRFITIKIPIITRIMSDKPQNPFAIEEDQFTNDPFADPSISHALNQNTYVSLDAGSSALDSDFGQMDTRPTTSGMASTTINMSGAAAASSAALPPELKSKEEELRRREEELERREQGLRQQEDAMRSSGFKVPNWPPFYPLIYHDIDDEVPEDLRPTVRRIYYFWLGTVGQLILNMIACLALLISHATTSGASDFGISLIYCFTITAMSFYLWYRPVYVAFCKDSSLFFYIFLLFEGFHVLYAGYMAVGLPGSGSAGLINFIAVLSYGNYGAAAICVLSLAGWIADALFASWMWTAVSIHTKRGGHSLNTARTQAVQMGVLSNL